MHDNLETKLTACVLGAALASPALGQFQPSAADNVVVGVQPSGLAYGDFDGDGDIDQATTVDGPDRVILLLNDGMGQFTPGPAVLLPNSSSPQDIVAGDFDGDTHMDLAVALRDPAGSVLLLRNERGTFVSAGSTTVGDRPRGMFVADHDGDTDLDISVANNDSDSVSVLTNDGSGAFSVQTLAIGGETRATVLADVVGDGRLDLALTNHDGRTVEVYENVAGTFVFSTSLAVNPNVRPDGIAAADLDDDEVTDLAVAVSDQTLGINQVSIFLNGPGGLSGPASHDTGGQNTSDVVAADLDCDGLIDLATANADSGNVSLLRNMGGAVFGAPQLVAVETTPGDIAAGDLDGDLDPDLSVANRDSNSISTIMNETCEPCPWDTGGDGTVDVTDLLGLLAAWGPNPGHPTDFDGNGSVDTTDLLTLLANWGGCP